jgi:penicillin-binding protein 1A
VFDGGNTLQGGSTLTMQLVNNVYLPESIADHHDLRYKIIQAKLANELESKHHKSWILTQYMNDVDYGTVGGQSAYGVGAASQMFFNKPVEKLDLAQIALLAGLPQAPSDYNPFLYPRLARQRRSEVLAAMVSSRYITRAQARRANRSGLQVQPNNVYGRIRQPYVFDYVKQQLIKDLGRRTVEAGGLKVYTTIDLTKQAEARRAILENEGQADDPAAALVSIDPANGHILALANSSNYGTGTGETTFDYATQAERQTGSAFKTFVLMTLIHDEDGDPNSTYYNSHLLAPGWLPSYPTYTVHTAELSYQGDISVTHATTISDNTVFAQLGVDLGMSNVDATAHAMGITAPLFGYPSEAIGGLRIGVSPLQMADAYATLANGGSHIPATIISKVVLPSGRTINLSNPTPKRIFTPGEAYAGTQVLQTVISSGTGTAASYGCPAAGKTGTTSNYTDAWFVGYTPQLSTAVWVGYPNATTSMTDVNGLGPGFGGTLAAPIWRDYMQPASDGYCSSFPLPAQYWSGKPYFGPHSVSGSLSVATNQATTTTPAVPTTTTPSGGVAAGSTTPPAQGGSALPPTSQPPVTPPVNTQPANQGNGGQGNNGQGNNGQGNNTPPAAGGPPSQSGGAGIP